jgi:hypothetical protein
MSTDQPAGHRQGQAVAAQMHAGAFDRQRHVEAIIDHELAAARACELSDFIRKCEQLFRTEIAFT